MGLQILFFTFFSVFRACLICTKSNLHLNVSYQQFELLNVYACLRIPAFGEILRNWNIINAAQWFIVLKRLSIGPLKSACKVWIIGIALLSNSFGGDKIRCGEALACFLRHS